MLHPATDADKMEQMNSCRQLKEKKLQSLCSKGPVLRVCPVSTVCTGKLDVHSSRQS